MLETGAPDRQVAIYGGSFNPPHICHLLTVLAVLEMCPIDEVWLVPTYQHAFNKSLADFDLRVQWCKKLIHRIEKHSKVIGIEREIGRESRTVDTLSALEHQYPATQFSLVLGSDIRKEKDAWKRFDLLEARYPIIWIGRSGQAEQAEDILVLPDVSSSEIRRRLSDGQPVDHWLPKGVRDAVLSSGFTWKV